MIIFLWRIHLSFQSHQMRIFSSGLVMAWNRGGLSCIILLGDSSLTRTLLDVDRLVVQLNQKPWGIAEK